MTLPHLVPVAPESRQEQYLQPQWARRRMKAYLSVLRFRVSSEVDAGSAASGD